ncbi:MAG: LemA family protein [Candidatus Riflebacteria bacterium]|nr:LemA family protein [Candidatus Riflebacteria bacterium]
MVTNDLNMAVVEAEFQRRNNIIRHLSGLVNKYIAFEEKMFKSTSEARALIKKTRLSGKVPEGDLLKALPGMVALAEQYPELKGSQVVESLMTELVESEKRIAAAKETFNTIVEHYNIHRKTFPGKLFGAAMGFPCLYYLGGQQETLKVAQIN